MGVLESLGALQVLAYSAAAVTALVAVALWVASIYADRLALRLFALRYALAAAGWLFASPGAATPDRGAPFASMMVAVGLLWLTAVALDVYLERTTRRRRWTQALLALAAAAALWVNHRVDPTDVDAIYLVMGAAMCWFAWIAYGAARSEHNVGHGIIAAAMLSYPLLVAARLAFPQRLGPLELGYLVTVPSVIVGVAILLASLVRFGRRLEASLQRQRAAEAALRELNARLEDRVSERTSELRQVVEGLQAFVRNVSHDLRGPLAGVAGVARLAQDALASGDTAKARRMLAPVAVQADRLAGLVQDLLTLSTAGEGSITVAEQPLDPVVDAALAQLKLAPESRGLLPAVTIERGQLPAWPIDAPLMQQVFVNLLGNAVRFAANCPARHAGTGSGSGAASEPPRVRIFTTQRAEGPAVVVEDNGPGFPAGRAAELFRPFARLHDASLSHNGIGLSIVQRIVERHGGRVWAEPASPSGARFCFTVAT
ncbi:MAG: HAMP domain-containing histidine kinase [Rubrivivax sp.]|nr:HAMP domain-containing histidine kinase [Rubrivivax sp.]